MDLRMCEDLKSYNKRFAFYFTITARLWYNYPIRTEQIFDLRMCEDLKSYNKRFAFIIPLTVDNVNADILFMQKATAR